MNPFAFRIAIITFILSILLLFLLLFSLAGFAIITNIEIRTFQILFAFVHLIILSNIIARSVLFVHSFCFHKQ